MIELNDHKCPGCGHKLNAVTGTNCPEDERPAPGDASICFYCGLILQFNKSLEPVKMNGQTLSLIKFFKPQIYKHLTALREEILLSKVNYSPEFICNKCGEITSQDEPPCPNCPTFEDL